jgi:hypothetical protein
MMKAFCICSQAVSPTGVVVFTLPGLGAVGRGEGIVLVFFQDFSGLFMLV